MLNPTETNIEKIISDASIWATQIVDHYQNSGRTLYKTETKIAHDVGVTHPHYIRVIEVEQVPEPSSNGLLALREGNGLLHSHSLGLTIGYSVFIKKGFASNHLLAHEFRHVYQFEQAGSVEKMIHNYLKEVLQFGYKNAPLEIDANNFSSAFLE